MSDTLGDPIRSTAEAQGNKRLMKIRAAEFPDGFGEDLMGDDEDRARLESLSQLEREKILQERHLERQKLLARRNFDAEQKSMLEKSSNSLVKRQLQNIKDEQVDLAFEKRVKVDTSGYRRPRPASSDRLINPAEDLTLLNQICVKRSDLIQLHNHLYFEDAVRYALLKVNHKLGSKNEYRLGMILSVKEIENRPYVFEGKTISKYLNVVFDKSSSLDVSFVNVSNREIDEREAFKCLEDLKELSDFQLDKEWIERKTGELLKFMNYKFTEEDMQKIRELKLEKLKAVSAETCLERKKLLEEKLAFLEGKNNYEYTIQRENEIEEVTREIASLRQMLQSQTFSSRFDNEKDQFMSFKSEKDKVGEIFQRKMPNPHNMWSISKEALTKLTDAEMKMNEVSTKPETKGKSEDLIESFERTKREFLKIFDRVLPIDAIVDSL